MEQPFNIYCKTIEHFEALYLRPKPGRALVVGSHVYKTRDDRRKRFADAIGIDMIAGEGVDYVANLEVDLPYHLGPFSHIDCVSVLEHSKQPWLLAKNLQYLLHSGDTILVEVPFVWRIHAYPDDYWRITASGLRVLFPDIEWQVIQYVPGAPEQKKLESITHNEQVHFLKCELCAFGAKR